MRAYIRQENTPSAPLQGAWHLDRRVWAGLGALFSGLAALAGCADGEPRRAHFPLFDARAPFMELTPGAAGTASDSAQTPKTNEFEKAIAESMQQADSDPADPPGTPVPVQTQQVELPGGLMSTIPLDFDEWQWERTERATIITHRLPGKTQPDAMIYAQGFSPLVRTYPSREVQRFIAGADPALLPLWTSFELAADAAGTDATIKSGFTLNYQSSRDSFTGWQWLGHNSAHVEIRLGRTQGQWRGMEGDTHIDRGNAMPRSSAWMLIGSARVKGDLGAHLAITCKAAPRCAVAAELSEFLDRLRPVDSPVRSKLR